MIASLIKYIDITHTHTVTVVTMHSTHHSCKWKEKELSKKRLDILSSLLLLSICLYDYIPKRLVTLFFYFDRFCSFFFSLNIFLQWIWLSIAFSVTFKEIKKKSTQKKRERIFECNKILWFFIWIALTLHLQLQLLLSVTKIFTIFTSIFYNVQCEFYWVSWVFVSFFLSLFAMNCSCVCVCQKRILWI